MVSGSDFGGGREWVVRPGRRPSETEVLQSIGRGDNGKREVTMSLYRNRKINESFT